METKRGCTYSRGIVSGGHSGRHGGRKSGVNLHHDGNFIHIHVTNCCKVVGGIFYFYPSIYLSPIEYLLVRNM